MGLHAQREGVHAAEGLEQHALALHDGHTGPSGAGAAAVSIVKLLLSAGYKHVTMCDRKGAIYAGRDGLNWIKEEMAQVSWRRQPSSLR